MAAQHPMFGRMAWYSAVIGVASGLALIGAAGSAQAQMWGGWFGGWHAAPGPYAAPIPARRVAGIVASEGYALNGTPRRDGDVIIAYTVLYAIARFVLEFFRGDADRGFVFGGALSTSQFIGLILFVVAAATFFLRKPARP